MFCWDLADEGALAGVRKRFCSTNCQKKKGQPREQGWPTVHPPGLVYYGKPTVSYDSKGDALLAAARLYRKRGGDFSHPYECPCGAWHLAGAGRPAEG